MKALKQADNQLLNQILYQLYNLSAFRNEDGFLNQTWSLLHNELVYNGGYKLHSELKANYE
jgi:hypothetical protein